LLNNRLEIIYQKLLSTGTQRKSERIFLIIAILSFLIHLSIIFLVNFRIINLEGTAELFKNPIAAIYTPFSFILVYEVYLLNYYLPRSLTTYVNKQYEIILLIIMRRLFKDLAKLEISSDFFFSLFIYSTGKVGKDMKFRQGMSLLLREQINISV